MTLKPIPPTRYDGEPDANTIQRFAREATTYVKMGHIPKDQQVYYVSYYLDGKALNFYNQVVSKDEENWDLKRFFIELFEFCFPVDFRNTQRKQLNCCFQGTKTVAAHVAEWQHIWNTIGLEDTQEKIVKLFNSFTYPVQTEIYRKNIDPEVNAWDEVVKAAEQAEVLLKLANRNQDSNGGSSKRPAQTQQKQNGSSRDSNSQGGQRPSHSGFRGRGRGRGGRVRFSLPREEVMRTSSAGMNEKPGGMSDQKRNEMLAKGLCFTCGEPGHLARNCSKTRAAPSKTKNRPPGLHVHFAEMGMQGYSSRDALNESTEVLETFQVGAVRFGNLHGVEEGGEPLQTFADSSVDSETEFDLVSEISSTNEINSVPERPIGDIYAMYTELMLQNAQPYPEIGDVPAGAIQVLLEKYDVSEGVPVDDKFEVQPQGEALVISDRQNATCVFLSRKLLEDHRFDLAEWYNRAVSESCSTDSSEYDLLEPARARQLGDVLGNTLAALLDFFQPYPGDESVPWSDDRREEKCFRVSRASAEHIAIKDTFSDKVVNLPLEYVREPKFHMLDWYARQKSIALNLKYKSSLIHEFPIEEILADAIPDDSVKGIARTASIPRLSDRVVARPLVIVVRVNGEPVRALVDSGSLGDLVSTSLADQLRLKRKELKDPITLQLAVQGSRSKINHSVNVKMSYQDIAEERSFLVANLSGYDMILGTAWLFQHKVSIGLNPARVCVGSADAVPLEGVATARVFTGAVGLGEHDALQAARDELLEYAKPICKTADERGLPPLRAINHTIPLIDENKILPWSPSRCPEALRPQWDKKRSTYLKAGRWQVTNAGNTAPMLLIPK
ncbi:hypothetical protein K438DRAFT_1611694, partial [Mycena galopus ATCC 62051]